MTAMPEQKGVSTFYAATHWQKQLHYFPKLNAFEFSFPFKKDTCNKIVNLFLDVVDEINKASENRSFPVTIGVEARINRATEIPINPSAVLTDEYSLENQYVFHLELLSFTPNPEYVPFCIKLAEKWANDKSLNGRPHWAKYWDFDNEDYRKKMYPYVREIYGEGMQKWSAVRNSFDPQGRFLNSWMKTIFYPDEWTSTTASTTDAAAPVVEDVPTPAE